MYAPPSTKRLKSNGTKLQAPFTLHSFLRPHQIEVSLGSRSRRGSLIAYDWSLVTGARELEGDDLGVCLGQVQEKCLLVSVTDPSLANETVPLTKVF